MNVNVGNRNTQEKSQQAWLDLVIQRLGPDDFKGAQKHIAEALGSPCRTDPEDPVRTYANVAAGGSIPARLLAFYIDKAWADAASGKGGKVARARRTLDELHATLLGANKKLAPPPPPEPVAAPVESTSEGALEKAIRLAYKLILKRTPADEEVLIWLRNFASGLTFPDFLLAMNEGEEAQIKRAETGATSGKVATPDKKDGEFILDLYRIVLRRGCTVLELENFRRALVKEDATRADLIVSLFEAACQMETQGADHAVHDGLSCRIMGTGKTLTLIEWQEKAKDSTALAAARKALRPVTPYVLTGRAGVRVSAIASLYRGGDFIEQFMDNITGQTCFDRHCELIIVDAASPENEAETIARYLKKHDNIRYQRTATTIGIYEAWNVGVDMARGRYLTNTNLDDLRREDSLEIQAGALDALPFVDVVYQDFYYSFDPRLDWAGVAAFGYKSNVPVITPANMLSFNSPHNAPMWRKALHDELGPFDASYKSAGDYEFWLRCLAADKMFYKINEPHVVYYQNPKGLSTRSDTRGVIEAKAVTHKYAPALLHREVLDDFGSFVKTVTGAEPPPRAFPNHNRHNVVQRALRDLARQFKQEAA